MNAERTVDPVEVDTMLRVLVSESSVLRATRWPNETARWHEFVTCVCRVVGGSETSPGFIDAAVDALIGLDLVDVEDLVDDADETEHDATTVGDIEFTREILVRAGFESASADTAVSAIAQAAQLVSEQYDGRIQALLRHHGQAMVDGLMAELKIPALDASTKRRVIVRWLQNILELPVPIRDHSVRVANRDIDVSAFVAAADRLDLNVAILDELLDGYEAEDGPDVLAEPEAAEFDDSADQTSQRETADD